MTVNDMPQLSVPTTTEPHPLGEIPQLPVPPTPILPSTKAQDTVPNPKKRIQKKVRFTLP